MSSDAQSSYRGAKLDVTILNQMLSALYDLTTTKLGKFL